MSSSESHATAPEQAPPSPNYVRGSEYLKYLAPSNDEIPVEDQPLPADASPTALSPGYVADSDPEDDPEEDLEEDPPDYPVDEGDDDEEEESSKDDDDEEKEEYLAPADFTLPVIDSVPSVEETKPFETDESAATPPPPKSPRIVVPLSSTGLCRARKTVIPQPPMETSTEALIVEYASAPIPPSPPPSSLSPLLFPLPQILSPPLPIPSPPLFLPSADCRSDIPTANMPFRKRLCLIAPAPRFEVEESSAAAAARQTGPDLTYGTDYGFIDTLDASIRDAEERAPTTLEEVDERVTDLATTLRKETKEMYVRHEDAQDDRAFLRAQINMFHRDRRYLSSMYFAFEREAMYSREAWSLFRG
ncbi:hypothetical protein Tco_0087160 [Tanacetum coccineum]